MTAFLNLGIHVYLSPMHLQEKFYIGVLFLIGSAALAVVVVGLATDRDRPRTLAWLVGFATSVVMLIAFVLSRTMACPVAISNPGQRARRTFSGWCRWAWSSSSVSAA